MECRSGPATRRRLKTVRPVVFDCDGVLVDSEFAWIGALRDALIRHGVVVGDGATASMIGGSVPEAIEYIEERLGRGIDQATISEQIYDDVLARLALGVQAMDGAIELLERLHGTRALAIASNGSRETVAASNRAAGIPSVFDAIVALDGILRPKPAPDLYIEACLRLGVHCHDAIAIEDSLRGAISARAAGLRVIGVGGGARLGEECDLVVSSLRDVRLQVFLDQPG
jgi:HAD superfamily hydrolase (TIGR01509 family)